jgi:regulator of cell morphogenesis and NO signaling
MPRGIAIMKSGADITADMRINDVVRLHPETVRVFDEFGMDACCGGARPIAEAAALHHLDVDQIVEALNAAAAP